MVHAVVHTRHFINKHNVKCKPYGPWGHFLGQCTLKLITLSLRRPRGAQEAFPEPVAEPLTLVCHGSSQPHTKYHKGGGLAQGLGIRLLGGGGACGEMQDTNKMAVVEEHQCGQDRLLWCIYVALPTSRQTPCPFNSPTLLPISYTLI